jgi:aminoglycoside phosphotransferase family enzyme/predicted kinase
LNFERIDTHLSCLLLAGDEVFKFKKPVRLPFADYSTPALRRRYCDEELRLNRRTAPALYRGVIELAGEPVLWMRRFDGAGLFDALARRGALSALHIDALAAEIARFQATLPPSPPTFDAAALAAHWAAANLHELQELAGPLPDLVAWDAAQAQAAAPLLQARQAAGRVVEGHGDLHLANIVWHQGRPLLFDALEFDPGLRHADRLADPAFTFMDLLDHDLPALAWRLLSQWLEAGGDHDALPLLRWSAGYRALVRAKVAWLQRRPDLGARRIALARSLAFPAAPPQLVLTTGLSGSGKSTVALQLVERFGGVRVRSDVERKRLHGLLPAERPADPAQIYNPQGNALTYARLEAIARAGLAGGVTVIVDAAFLKRAERDTMRALAAAAGVRCRLIECVAAPATLAARIAQRQATAHDASDATLEVLALQQRVQEPLAPDEGAERLETEGTPADVAARVQALPA